MTVALAPVGFDRRAARDLLADAVPARALLGLLFALAAVPQVLLWRFLGFGAASIVVGALAVAVLGWGAVRRIEGDGPSLRVTLACLAIAAGLLVLGGEGRFFYANPDWEVRDAVLRDLVVYPWPWAYDVRSTPDLLRVPAAMYLAPAFAGKALGGFRAAELALLAQNTAFLGALLALGATLFDRLRARLIALAVFVAFSGMDVVGTALVGGRLGGHLEWWSSLQYSAHLTQIFWVPQHAFAGWAGALLFLLWHRGRLPLVAFLAPLPLLALWSPLALIGLMPFAAQAGASALIRRNLRRADFAWPAAATLLAVPGLLYLAAGSGAVGGRAQPVPLAVWFTFVALEALPLLLAARMAGARARFAGTLPVVALMLLALPFAQVGQSADLMMRASIPALAILAVMLADLIACTDLDERGRAGRRVALAVLAIGAVTAFNEARRAFSLPTAPEPRCSYFGAVPGGADTYVAPLASLSPLVRPTAPALIRPDDPARCWDRPWPRP